MDRSFGESSIRDDGFPGLTFDPGAARVLTVGLGISDWVEDCVEELDVCLGVDIWPEAQPIIMRSTVDESASNKYLRKHTSRSFKLLISHKAT